MKDKSTPSALQNLKGKLHIHMALVGVIVALLILSAGSIIIVNYMKTTHAYEEDAFNDIERTKSLVTEQIKGFFVPTHKFLLVLKQMLEDDEDLTENQDFASTTMSLLNTFARFKTLGYGDEQGNAVVVSAVFRGSVWKELARDHKITNAKFVIRVIRNENGAYKDEVRFYDKVFKLIKTIYPTSSELEPYHANKRPWFEKAVAKKRGIWTDLYQFANGVDGVSTAFPLYGKNGEMRVVLFADVTLGIIRNYLSVLPLGQNGFGAIVDTNGKVIVESDSEKACNYCLENLKVYPSQVVHAAYLDAKENNNLDQPFKFRFLENNLLCEFSPFKKVFTADWRLALIIPETDYIGHIRASTMRVTIISICILVVAIIIIYLLAHIITKPILALSSDMRRIQDFDIDPSHSVKSFLYEICQMSNTLTRMKSSLQTFGYYVPKNLVRQLINKGIQAKLGGEKKKLTVMFTDVYDFTHIAETEDVDKLIHQTSEYLESISVVVDKHHGTIDKFIGDGVMAFWGAPENLNDHVKHACEAILTCREEINALNKSWEKEGKPLFLTRFSLNTGDTIIGNLGSYLRMNYTAFGDTVNVCSRLESLNKVYETEIIVGESVYEEVKDYFIFRLIDFIAVKGKVQGIKIYELVSSRVSGTTEEDELSKLFEKAFTLYSEKEWDEAEKLYKELKSKTPNRKIADIFLERIAEYRKNPPQNDWKGLTNFYHK